MEEKEATLAKILLEMRRVLIAYSGGVDSTYLLYKAREILGKEVVAVIAASETFPAREYDAALTLAKKLDVRVVETVVEELSNPAFSANNPDRCYHCKTGLFSHLQLLAQQYECAYILDGSNQDDLGDYRPGSKAKEEQGVRSPLQEARLGKKEIRELSRLANLPTWDKPSFACLSSRIPYGIAIDQKKIDQLDQAENFLLHLGIRQVRIRHHDTIARIEVVASDMDKVLAQRETIQAELKKLGFTYVTLDLQGYRTGSMNEVLP